MSGSSNSAGKEQILDWFTKNQHTVSRILDLGAGSGTYSRLIKSAGILNDAEWVAVEAWKPYIDRFNLKSHYSSVFNQDIRKLDWSTMRHFDVTIAGDVLEHVSKEEAISVVENVLKHSKTLIISIPVVHYPQEAVDGNPFEIHVKDDWSHEEVMSTWGDLVKHHFRKSRKSKVAVYWLSLV